MRGVEHGLARKHPKENGSTFVPDADFKEVSMRNTLFFLSLAAGLAIACVSSAGAIPVSAAAVKEVTAITSPLESRAVCSLEYSHAPGIGR
jgi:hypothetical protein